MLLNNHSQLDENILRKHFCRFKNLPENSFISMKYPYVNETPMEKKMQSGNNLFLSAFSSMYSPYFQLQGLQANAPNDSD